MLLLLLQMLGLLLWLTLLKGVDRFGTDLSEDCGRACCLLETHVLAGYDSPFVTRPELRAADARRAGVQVVIYGCCFTRGFDVFGLLTHVSIVSFGVGDVEYTVNKPPF